MQLLLAVNLTNLMHLHQYYCLGKTINEFTFVWSPFFEKWTKPFIPLRFSSDYHLLLIVNRYHHWYRSGKNSDQKRAHKIQSLYFMCPFKQILFIKKHPNISICHTFDKKLDKLFRLSFDLNKRSIVSTYQKWPKKRHDQLMITPMLQNIRFS